MTVRKAMRRGAPRLVIDIPYKTAEGRTKRYRKDAQVQTLAGAKAEERRLLQRLAQVGYLDADSVDSAAGVTFADAVAHYRRTHARSRLRRSTRDGYDRVIDTELVPRFGTRLLMTVDHGAVAEMDAEFAVEGLAASTRANIQVVLRSVLRNALVGGLLDRMPRLPALPRAGLSVVQTLHPSELEAILAAAPPNQRLAFALAAYAGLRAGEVRGLRWPDVDLKRRVITVRRTLVRGAEGPPKSGHGRVVPVAAPLLPLLTAAEADRSSPWSEVAVTVHGKPWGDTGLLQARERAQARVGLKGWGMHSLRHFFITELCRRGAATMVVKQLAGHAELSTTQRYAHMVGSDLEAAISLFGGDRSAEVARREG